MRKQMPSPVVAINMPAIEGPNSRAALNMEEFKAIAFPRSSFFSIISKRSECRAGISKALKEFNPGIKCYIIEPESAAVIAGKKVTDPNHKIQGGGYSMPNLKFLKKVEVDGYIHISDTEAIEVARQLAEKEAIFGGFSSGANVAAALHLLKGEFKGKTIVCLICDSGLKYLSTDLWAPIGENGTGIN